MVEMKKTQPKTDEQDLIKIKTFLLPGSPREEHEKTVDTHTEKVVANLISDKGLVSTLYEELSKLSSKKISNPIRK